MKKLIIQIIFINMTIYGQVLLEEDLFDFNSFSQQKNIRLSETIRDEWNLSNSLIQLTYYNAYKDTNIDSVQSITKVMAIYNLFNKITCLELLDDGIHFDKNANDNIYANIFVDSNVFPRTDESIISVENDSIGINYSIILREVISIPSVPNIVNPQHNSTISNLEEAFIWELDPIADSCKVLILDNTPKLGVIPIDIIWEKEYSANSNNLFSEEIPDNLTNNQEYIFLIYSYSNTKIINDLWQRGAYSLEWSKFRIDTALNAKNDNFELSQIYPNPFNTRTFIKYSLPSIGNVVVKIFDIVGREVNTLVNKLQSSGDHYVYWTGQNKNGHRVANGVYICSVFFNGQQKSKKITFIK